jgi:TctA family transporter
MTSYIIAVICGLLAGLVHITIGDPLLTSLVVLISTMSLGFASPERPWRWTLLVGLMVPIVMMSANLLHYYETLTRAGLAGSILIMLPGVAGAYGGSVGRRFVRVMFQGKEN